MFQLISRISSSGAMADSSRDQDTATGPAAAAATAAPVPAVGGGSAEPPKKIPKGVVLGPDGKP